jgi:phenylacetate-coenzyme A ligase PaaK-like adenylate-forming protein
MTDFDEFKDFLSEAKDRHDFYGWLYDGIDIDGIGSMDDVRDRVPRISKEKLLEFFEDGNFDFGISDLEDPIIARPTSGTTSDMACYYRTKDEIDSHCRRFIEAADHFFTGGKGKDRIMIATTFSLLPIMVEQFLEKGCMATGGSPFDIERTAETIRVMGCNTLVVSPPVALKLSERLKEVGYDGIEKYYLISSGLPPMTEQRLKELYPDAEIMMQYGLAETGILMRQCQELAGTNSYHLFDDGPFHYEFVTDEGTEADPGEIGELVVTKLEQKTPLIRYAVGDLFEKQDHCDCGARTYRFVGRKEDKFKIQGVTVFRDRIEEALEPVMDQLKQYQVIIDQEDGEEMPRPTIHLRLEVDDDSQEALDEIAETFATNFQVAEEYTWAKGIEMGLFGPVTVEAVEFDERKFRTIKDQRYEDD